MLSEIPLSIFTRRTFSENFEKRYVNFSLLFSPSSNVESLLTLLPKFQFIERYAGHVVPLSKVPKGIQVAHPPKVSKRELAKQVQVSPKDPNYDEGDYEIGHDDDYEDEVAAVALTKESLNEAEIASALAELEAEDGGADGPSFDSSKISRVLDEELGSEEEEAAAFWKTTGGTSKSVGSKLVHLADILPPVPTKGDFDLERIRNSLYFFS